MLHLRRSRSGWELIRAGRDPVLIDLPASMGERSDSAFEGVDDIDATVAAALVTSDVLLVVVGTVANSLPLNLAGVGRGTRVWVHGSHSMGAPSATDVVTQRYAPGS